MPTVKRNPKNPNLIAFQLDPETAKLLFKLAVDNNFSSASTCARALIREQLQQDPKVIAGGLDAINEVRHIVGSRIRKDVLRLFQSYTEDDFK